MKVYFSECVFVCSLLIPNTDEGVPFRPKLIIVEPILEGSSYFGAHVKRVQSAI